MSVLTSKNYESLESYSALDDYQGDRDEIVPCCLDGLLEEQEEIDLIQQMTSYESPMPSIPISVQKPRDYIMNCWRPLV